MTNVSMQKNAYNDLNFSFKTSSGDKINLSMYDSKEFSKQSFKDNNRSIEQFSLKHSFGYKFSYKGNGIDANDQKEIDNALKKLQPKIDEFLKNVNQSGIPSPREFLNKAADLKFDLPKPKNEEHKNFMQDSILNLFDNSVKKYFPNQDVLLSAKKLFETLQKQLETFDLYA